MSNNINKLFQDFSIIVNDSIIEPIVQHLRTVRNIHDISNEELIQVVGIASVSGFRSGSQPLPGFPGQCNPQQQYNGNVCLRRKANTGSVCAKPLFEGTDYCKDCWKLVCVYDEAVKAGRTDIPQFAHEAREKRKLDKTGGQTQGNFVLQPQGGFPQQRGYTPQQGGFPQQPLPGLPQQQGFGGRPNVPTGFPGVPQSGVPQGFGGRPNVPTGFPSIPGSSMQQQPPQGFPGIPQQSGMPQGFPGIPQQSGMPQGFPGSSMQQQPPQGFPGVPGLGTKPQLPSGLGMQPQGFPNMPGVPGFSARPTQPLQDLTLTTDQQPQAPVQSNNPYQVDSTSSAQTTMSFLDEVLNNNSMSTDGYDNLDKYVVSSEGIIYYNEGDDETIVTTKAVGFLDLNRKVIRAISDEEKNLIMAEHQYAPELQPKQHLKPAVNGFGFPQPGRPQLIPGMQPPTTLGHN